MPTLHPSRVSVWGPELVDPGIRNPSPHAVNKSASPQPNPLAALRETTARLTVNLVLSIAFLGRLFLAWQLLWCDFTQKVCASRICWRYLVSRSVLPAPIPGYHAPGTYSTPVQSLAGSRRKFNLGFFFLSQKSYTNRERAYSQEWNATSCKHAT